MTTVGRKRRWLVTLAMAYAVGMLPSCASMGGGMRYDLLLDPPSFAGELSPV